MFLDPGFSNWNEKAWRMVAALRLKDPRVASALRRIPRHRFLSRGLWPTAYVDTPLPVGPEATISAPHMVAIQLELGDLQEGMKVLELGSGSGYVLALASLLVGPRGLVVGVEYEPSLVERSLKTLRGLGIRASELKKDPSGTETRPPPGAPAEEVRPVSTIATPESEPSEVRVLCGSGYHGCPTLAPFDRILVSYAGPNPEGEPWLEELKPEGKAVAPVELERYTELEVWKRSQGRWSMEKGPPCLFVRRKA